MPDESPRIEYMPLGEIERWPRNPKRHDHGQIRASMIRFGFKQPVGRDERSGRLYAGHGRTETLARMKAAGEPVPRAIRVRESDGEWLIPVLRGLAFASDSEAEAYVVADNRLVELGGWDDALLAQVLDDASKAADGLDGVGYTNAEVDALVAEAQRQSRPPPSEDPPAPTGPAVTKPGDLITLGRHRLLCGNSLDPAQLARLLDGRRVTFIYADPPYGVKEQTDRKSRSVKAKAGRFRPIVGDESTATAVALFQKLQELGARAQVWWGANHYADALPPSPAWFVWDKRVDDDQSNDGSDCELAWVKHPTVRSARIFRHLWKGMLRASERGRLVHPTQKPVALAEAAFERYGVSEDVVLDPTAGVGGVLLAAERTGRTALLCEIDPLYCDVIRARWEQEAGRG